MSFTLLAVAARVSGAYDALRPEVFENRTVNHVITTLAMLAVCYDAESRINGLLANSYDVRVTIIRNEARHSIVANSPEDSMRLFSQMSLDQSQRLQRRIQHNPRLPLPGGIPTYSRINMPHR